MVKAKQWGGGKRKKYSEPLNGHKFVVATHHPVAGYLDKNRMETSEVSQSSTDRTVAIVQHKTGSSFDERS